MAAALKGFSRDPYAQIGVRAFKVYGLGASRFKGLAFRGFGFKGARMVYTLAGLQKSPLGVPSGQAMYKGPLGSGAKFSILQKLQYPLIQEYTSKFSRIPHMI